MALQRIMANIQLRSVLRGLQQVPEAPLRKLSPLALPALLPSNYLLHYLQLRGLQMGL